MLDHSGESKSGRLSDACCDSGEPIIKNNQERQHQGASLRVQHKQGGSWVLGRKSHVCHPLTLRGPMWQFLPINESLLKDANWASPNTQIMKFMLGPMGTRKHVMRGETSGCLWHAVEEKHHVHHCHRPKCGICHIRPMCHHRLEDFALCKNGAGMPLS